MLSSPSWIRGGGGGVDDTKVKLAEGEKAEGKQVENEQAEDEQVEDLNKASGLDLS